MTEVRLVDLIEQAKNDPRAPQRLTSGQQASLLRAVTKRTRQGTRQTVAENIARPFSEWPTDGLIARLYVEGSFISYCVGQDHTSEIALLRQRLVQFR